MTRLVHVAALGVLLMVTVSAPVTAQEASDVDRLVALCEANAPDDATRDSCVHVAVTVLSTATVPTPWEDFEAGTTEVIESYTAPLVFRLEGEVLDTTPPVEALRSSGSWTPKDPANGRTLDPSKKKQAKRARVVAGMVASDMREFLLSVTPGDCYRDMYGALWGLASAWQYYSDGLGNPKRLLDPAVEEFVRAESVTHCKPPRWRIEMAPLPITE